MTIYTATPQVVNFDPNMNFCGRRTKKTIRLTLGMWDYRLTVEQTVSGNTTGLSVIRAACEFYGEEVADSGIILTRESDGATLLCQDEEGQEEEWIFDMLISAEIVDMQPAGEWGKT